MGRDSAYVAVYDVSDDRERDRLATVLEGFGMRVQFSAFELRLTPATRQTLLRRVEDLRLKTGFVYLYRRGGSHDRAAVGEVPENSLGDDRHAFVVAEAPLGGRRRCRGAAEVAGCRAVQARNPKVPERSPDNPVLPDGFALSVGGASKERDCQTDADQGPL
jgi:CRISPR-associated protein Cas2